MRFDFDPFVRYIAKSRYFLPQTVVARDCRMLYILSGEGTFSSGEQAWRLIPSTLIYWPAGTPYCIRSLTEDGMLFYSLNFDFTQAFSHVAETLPPQPARQFSVGEALQSYKEFEGGFDEIQYFSGALWAEPLLCAVYDETVKKQEGYRDVQRATMRIFLIEILRRLRGGDAQHLLCRRIEDVLAEDLSQNNADIAKKLGYHPYYLNSLFRSETGGTLHQYILSRRLAKSYELITTTDFSVERIAAECGFSSQSYFTCVFRGRYRITPLQLRRQI